MSKIEEDYAERGLVVPSSHEILPFRANSVGHFDADTVKNDALQTRIVTHPRFFELVNKFLDYKRRHGTAKEKQLYADMTAGKEIARLFRNRPMSFFSSGDNTLLRDGTLIRNAAKLWDAVGTDSEKEITLKDYLSYDEIMLGSFMGVSSPSTFINDGDRHNGAVPGKPGTFEPRGIIVGLVGARFERPEHMDSTIILNRPKTRRRCISRQVPELTKIFLDFLQVERTGDVFDVKVYRARMKIPLTVLLLEADARAQAESPPKKAYVYVVGLGLGVWQIAADQPKYYVQALCEVLQELRDQLSRIATIELAWINVDQDTQDVAIRTAAEQGIKVKFSRRNPAAKLAREEEDQLLVLSYAWDANSYPGNEYWTGALSSSGDPAAAAMSTIAEIQSPRTNPRIWKDFESL
ncbi:hypothetical protein GGR52DRAFT_144201 [Hypoxylon sp. FL1284]|nr:hypothetical protein GGR52DRAFT_144201 [Hypoxylon sp. FL1284]